MATTTEPLPQSVNRSIPRYDVKGAARAIEFYKRAFGAKR